MRFAGVAVLCLAYATWAQAPVATPPEPPKTEASKIEQSLVLQNTGKPMVFPFQCTDDDMQWAGMSCTEEEPCPVYMELTAVESVGNRIVTLGNIPNVPAEGPADEVVSAYMAEENIEDSSATALEDV